MRATGQARNLTGPLDAEEAKVVVARAILGEWLGGSGGGWQDSGGIFPGIKLIQGVIADPGRPRVGRQPRAPAAGPPPAGRLVQSRIAAAGAPAESFPDALARSLVLVHGGMAQNVGPILNMVTAKYLLRGREEWLAPAGARDLRPDPRGRRSEPTSAPWGLDHRELGRPA